MAKILLAEDDDMSRDIIRTRLTRNGHEVTAVCNGGECLIKAHEEPFDIFILDISMPVKDGLQTLKELKTLPGASRTPALALTVHSMDRDREKAIEAVGKYDGHGKLVRFQITLYQGFVLVAVSGEKKYI